MQKQFVSETHARIIKWIEGGRILVCDLEGKVLSIENYSKAALSKIIKFVEKTPTSKMTPAANFNAAGKKLLDNISGFDLDESLFGIINNAETATNKIYHYTDKNNQVTTKMYIHTKDSFKMNMRYEMVIDSDGTIQFEEFEEILPENLNNSYEIALLNVYECTKG